MKCQYVVISESLSLDAATGKVSLFHVIDRINIVQSPFIIQSLNLVSLFEREAGDANSVEYDLETSLDGSVIANFKQTVFFEADQKLTRNFIQLQGAIIPGDGVLSFKVKLHDTLLGYWNIIVERANPILVSARVAGSKPKARRQSKRRSKLNKG